MRRALSAWALVVLLGMSAAAVGLRAGAQSQAPLLRHDPVALAAAVPARPTRSAPPAAAAAPRVTQADPAWLRRVAASTGIPVPALTAYADATLRLQREDPGCRLGWTTLAGIGEVESVHGTIGGRLLRADGRPSRPIVGPALDGADGVAAIPASQDGARLHGDTRWDHAVGPLQFLPSTWTAWGVDADGDGRADPQDIDDAAYAAARYLCASGIDLTTADGWQAAVLSYNHDRSYVAAVYAAAVRYASGAAS